MLEGLLGEGDDGGGVCAAAMPAAASAASANTCEMRFMEHSPVSNGGAVTLRGAAAERGPASSPIRVGDV